MRCYRCDCTMDKDYETRTATCPICGRTTTYRSNADKKRGYRYDPDDDDYEPISPFYWFVGNVVGWGIIILIVAVVFGVLFLTGVFKNGFWAGLGDIGMFFLKTIWSVICFIGRTIGGFFTLLFHLIFG